MVKVVNSTVIRAPIDTVWHVLRDFNGHDRWHPAVDVSQIERGKRSDMVGCVRSFKLADGSALREQLLALSDSQTSFSYCLLDTPVPLLNYVAHVELIPVTDGDRTFWRWQAEFSTPRGMQEELVDLVGNGIQVAGFEAIREITEGAAQAVDLS